MSTLFDDLVDGGGDLYFDNLDSAPITGDEPQIVSVGTLRYLGNATIAGSQFGASQGAGLVTIGGVVQPVVSWSDTSIVIGPIARGALRYGTQNVIVSSDADGSSNPSAQTLLPQTGWNYVNLVAPLATSGQRVTGTPDFANGDQLAYGNVAPSGTVTVATNTAFTATAGVGSFVVECNDGTGWGSFGTQFVANVAAFTGSLASRPATMVGAFSVQVPSTARTFSGTLRSAVATMAGAFLAFTSKAFDGDLVADGAGLQGSFFVIGALTPTPAPPTQAPGTGTPEAKVAIVNAALLKLGASTINAFTDDQKAARVASVIYGRVVDRELAKHTWRFALSFRRLPEFVSDEPREGYRYTYAKPVDWLQTIWIGEELPGTPGYAGDVEDADWHHSGEYILSNRAAPLPLHYVRRITDPTRYHVLFSEALACALAMEMCESVTGSTSRWDAMRDAYRDAVNEARRANAILDPPRRSTSSEVDSWLSARD